MIDAKGWARIDAAVDEAMALPIEGRTDFLTRRFADDAETLTAALRVVGAMDAAEDFLEPNRDGSPSLVIETISEGGRFGAWAVEEELGRGGMGVVYGVARVDGGFEQRGALKRMRADGALDTARFEAERQVLARLDHPGIARLLDGGIDAEGHPWMVMERVDGMPIDQWAAASGASLEQRIAAMIAVLDAVGSAHRMLVLHRDLKPANVLVDGEGRQRVIDFGIAKRMDMTDQTAEMLPLSAPYAAPELLTGAPVGPPVDVYGASAMLYELAAGVPPIDLSGIPVALAVGRILDHEPARLSSLNHAPVLTKAPKALVADLDAILAKALRKDADARYPTVEALRADLKRALEGRTVAARAGDRAYRIRRGLWRARWPIAASGAVLLTLSGGLIATNMQRIEAEAARDAALAEEERGEAVRQSLYLILAESAELAGGDSSSRDVLDRATLRIVEEFKEKPEDTARLLHALGELHYYLGDYEAAVATLTPLFANKTGNLPPEIVAAAHYDMAQAQVRLGKVDEARPHLVAAQAFWKRDPIQWRARLLDSRLTEAQILRATDPAGAVALLRSAAADHAAIYGTDNRLAGIFQANLGVSLQAVGDLDGATVALRKAQAIWVKIGMEESPEALNILNNLAAIELFKGRPEVAESLFADVVRLRRKLFGGSGATAAALSNHGKTLLQLGRVPEAITTLNEAAIMAEKFTGAGSIHHIAALSGLADAQVAARMPVALSTARRSVDATKLGKAPPPATAMAYLSLAKAQKAAGDRAGARASLKVVEDILPSLGPAGARLAEGVSQVKKGL